MLFPKVTTTPRQTVVEAPYNPEFTAGAKRLHGKYSSQCWTFDPRDDERVRTLCRETWGAIDGEAVELVTVRLTIESRSASEVYFCGRKVLERRSRDAAVKLGPSCVILSGRFAGSGGSVKNPSIGAGAGGKPVVIEVRDLPRAFAESEAADLEGAEVILPVPPPAPEAVPAAPEPAPAPLSGRTHVLRVVTVQHGPERWSAQLVGEGAVQWGKTELEAFEYAVQLWIRLRCDAFEEGRITEPPPAAEATPLPVGTVPVMPRVTVVAEGPPPVPVIDYAAPYPGRPS